MTTLTTIAAEITWVVTWHWIDEAWQHHNKLQAGTDLDQIEVPEEAVRQHIKFGFEVVLVPAQALMKVTEVWGTAADSALRFEPGSAGSLTIGHARGPVVIYAPGTWARVTVMGDS